MHTAPARPHAARPVVVLDPGHNGGNASHPERINASVPAGRGRSKPCNSTGTAADDGYTEHAFTWDVTLRVRKALERAGYKVVLTRKNDAGVGPCVNDRAAIGNRAKADAVVSVHADGNTGSGATGFHVAYSNPPLNKAQGQPAATLARAVLASMKAMGFKAANYIGSGGLAGRNDLAGLNLSTRPAVLVECGNMRNATEAGRMQSVSGRQRYADAIAAGIVRYVNG